MTSASTNRHITVLLDESVNALAPALERESAVALDCTLGGAGHTHALLQRFPNLRLTSCDVDPRAIAQAKELLGEHVESTRLTLAHTNFADFIDKTKLMFDGVLMDLGFSSNQMENPEYGLSFSADGPIDMRLGKSGADAWALLEESSEKELADILYAYGELHTSRKIAQRIKEGLSEGTLKNSTRDLAHLLEKAVGYKKNSKDIHPATLVFQALRIATNDELRKLDHFLENVILKLKPGGRIAVISFHSLEDRIVKQWGVKHGVDLAAINKKPIEPSPEEIGHNPRARSAKLRVFERR